MAQREQVSNYFDSIASTYRSRYGNENPYHAWFFRQRIEAATQNLDLQNKVLLDIGAGTGALYDALVQKNISCEYYACDISPNMLSQSRIPAERQFVGEPGSIDFPVKTFDYIFMLGVTTYQTPEEFSQTLDFIRQRLAADGMAIVSFTNRASLDYLLRRVLSVFRPLARKSVLGQSFQTYSYRPKAMQTLLSARGLHLSALVFLNQTFSPLNTLFPRLSVSLARWLSRNSSPTLLSCFSADFLVFLYGGDR